MNAVDIESRRDDMGNSLAERFPKGADLMHEAREDVLAFRHPAGALAQDLEHQPARFSEATMAKIREQEDALEFTDADLDALPSATIS